MSNSFCPVTGDYPCYCKSKLAVSPIGSALLVDIKSALRKLFTDHINYTNLVIITSLSRLESDNSDFVKRLLQNPIDIANLLAPIVGKQIAGDVRDGFTNHLTLANDILGHVRDGDKDSIAEAVNKFYEQGDVLSETLHNINTNKLPLETLYHMIRQHNEFVIKLAILRAEGQMEEYIQTFDTYYKHGLSLSDAICEALY